jgi:hypothetical protein
LKGLNVAYESYLEKIKESRKRDGGVDRDTIANFKTPLKMDEKDGFRHLQWNIEWMDYLFGEDNDFRDKNKHADITDVDDLCRRIAKVIISLNPDVISIEEGPSSKEKMEKFVKKYLNNSFEVLGGLERLTQQLYLLVRKNGPIKDAKIHRPSLKCTAFSFSYF